MTDEKTKTGEQSQETGTPSGTGSAPRPKKSPASIGLICAVIFLILYAVVNISVFSGIFSKLLSVLAPIILGGALAYLLNPILKLFEFRIFKKISNKKVLRGLSLLMTYIVVLLVVVAFCWLVIPQLIDSIMRLATNFNGYIESTADTINGFIAKLLDRQDLANVVDDEAILSAITTMLFKSGDLFSGIMGYVVEYGAGLFVGIKNLVLAIFISIYILSAKERLKAQVMKLTTAIFTHKGKRRFYRYVRLCNHTFGGFFIGKIINSLIIGVITLAVLLIFRMPYALLVSTIVCITDIIPVFGPIIGAIPSFFIIFIVSPSKALLFLVLILLIQQLDGNVIGPKILGNTTGISSLGVIISIVIMGEFFGVIGMIIGVPLFAVIVALCKEFIEHRLKKKSLTTDTAAYYAADSLVDPNEVHEPVAARIFNNMGQSFAKLFRKKKKAAPPQEEESGAEEKQPDQEKDDTLS